MRKYRLIIILSLLFLTAAPKFSQAQVIIKIPNIGEDITTTLTKWKTQAENLLDQAGNLSVVKTIGKGFSETQSWIKSNLSDLKAFRDQVQAQVDDAKAAYDEVKGAYDDVKGAYDDTVGQYQQIYSDIKALEDRYQSINNKIEEMSSEYNQQVNAQKAVWEGEKNTLTDNMSQLEKIMAQDPDNKEAYQTQYEEMLAQKKELDKKIEDFTKEAEEQLLDMTSAYDDEMKGIKTDIARLKSNLMKLGGIQEETSAEDALLNTTDVYFLQYDEELNPERQDQIRRNRFRERRKSIIDAYTNAIKYIPNANDRNFSGEDLGYGASTFDTSAGAWGANARINIEYLKALSDYAHLLVYDIKSQTAIEVAKMKFYKLEKEQTNITEFNLDDYVYEEKKKGDK